MEQRNFLVAFANIAGIGSVRLKLLLEYFGSAEKAWMAPVSQITSVGLPKNVLAEFLAQRIKINPHQYYESVVKRGIKVITILDKDYPERLRNICDPPNVLFIKSNLETAEINSLFKRRIIAVVGTRKMTAYGKDVTAKLTQKLVDCGFVIVSGLALGIDGIAHGTAIAAGGKTLAVLGAGVEVIYPREHTDLYQSIIDHGGVILSEVAPDRFVNKGVFVARNRIISGLSEAVLITEGAIESGSLITARVALEQGKDVFAVPGPINSPTAEGTNYLLKQGASLVTGVEDILEVLEASNL